MNPKTILIVVGVIFVVLLTGAILLYRSGKKRGEQTGVVNISAPSDDKSVPTSTSDIRSLAQSVFEDMDGVNSLGHDISLWNRVLILSDNDFIKFNNEFNLDFQKESEQSFKVWVSNESTFLQPEWGTVRQAVLGRLAKLNIS